MRRNPKPRARSVELKNSLHIPANVTILTTSTWTGRLHCCVQGWIPHIWVFPAAESAITRSNWKMAPFAFMALEGERDYTMGCARVSFYHAYLLSSNAGKAESHRSADDLANMPSTIPCMITSNR